MRPNRLFLTTGIVRKHKTPLPTDDNAIVIVVPQGIGGQGGHGRPTRGQIRTDQGPSDQRLSSESVRPK